jgi:hypothetical protein
VPRRGIRRGIPPGQPQNRRGRARAGWPKGVGGSRATRSPSARRLSARSLPGRRRIESRSRQAFRPQDSELANAADRVTLGGPVTHVRSAGGFIPKLGKPPPPSSHAVFGCLWPGQLGTCGREKWGYWLYWPPRAGRSEQRKHREPQDDTREDDRGHLPARWPQASRHFAHNSRSFPASGHRQTAVPRRPRPISSLRRERGTSTNGCPPGSRSGSSAEGSDGCCVWLIDYVVESFRRIVRLAGQRRLAALELRAPRAGCRQALLHRRSSRCKAGSESRSRQLFVVLPESSLNPARLTHDQPIMDATDVPGELDGPEATRQDSRVKSHLGANPHACTPDRRGGNRKDSDHNGDQRPPRILASVLDADRDQTKRGCHADAGYRHPNVISAREPAASAVSSQTGGQYPIRLSQVVGPAGRRHRSRVAV